MNADKLREAAGKIAGQLSLDYDISEQRVLNIIIDVMTPLFLVPAPVDDKALAEAIEWLTTDVIGDAQQKRYLSDNGFHHASLDRRIRMGETVLAALRAARQYEKWYNELIEVIYGERSEGENERPDPRLVVKAMSVAALKLEAAQQEVWNSWDAQAVGKLLGVPLGKPIHPAIAPGIEALQAEVNELRATNDGPWNMISNIADTLCARGFEEGPVDERVIAMAQALDKARPAGEGKGAT